MVYNISKIRGQDYIQFSHLTRGSCGKCNYIPSGRNRTCETAVLVQRSNQVSYRGQLSSSNHKFSTCSNTGSIRDDPYWTSRENSLELMELSSINKVSLI